MKFIRSKRSGKIYEVLKEGVRHLVQLVSSPHHHESEKEPFYLDHDHYEEIDPGVEAAKHLSRPALIEAAREAQELGDE